MIVPAALGAREAHEALRTQPFIRYDRRLWSGRIADEYLREVGIRPAERLELDGLEAISVLVDRGLGVSLVPNWSTPWPEGLTLAKLPLPAPAPVRTLGMMWTRGSPRLPLIAALVDMALR